jgi:hypothetical protein
MLHFAPRYGIVSPCLTRSAGQRLRRPANDNGGDQTPRNSANDDIGTREEALLEAALRMFAAHGLSAALRACEAAEIAAASGDCEGADWWLSVCATFDGAMARAFKARQTAGR